MQNHLAAALAALVLSLTLAARPVHAQFGSWNPIQDIAKGIEHVKKEADKAVPGASDALTIINAPAAAPHRIVEGVVPGVHINPFDPLRGPVVTTPGQAADNLRRLPQDLEDQLNPAGTLLAEAIRRGEARALASCRPVPTFVRRALRGRLAAATLDRACFSTDWGATQNGTLQQFLLANGYATAVTLNRAIVFASPDDALTQDAATLDLWAHELTHVEQYAHLGVAGFARRYADDFGARLEAEAEAHASRLTADLDLDDAPASSFAAADRFSRPAADRFGRPVDDDGVGPPRRPVQPAPQRWVPAAPPVVYTYCASPVGNSPVIAGGLPGTPCHFPTPWGPAYGLVVRAR